MRQKNYYEILGVEPQAPAFAIENAYWRLARDLHKQTGDTWAAAALLSLNEAYERLGDARNRAAYNREMGLLPEEPPARQTGLRRLWPWSRARSSA